MGLNLTASLSKRYFAIFEADLSIFMQLQSYKIFLHDSFLIIEEGDEIFPNNLKSLLKDFDIENLKKQSFKIKNAKKFIDEIEKDLKLIEAAGGIVENKNGDILSIFRLGFWDLPKGKIEKKEKSKDCAVREVMEECGLKTHPIVKSNKPIVTYHLYELNSKTVLKKTYWFKMFLDTNELMLPQIEEGITKVEWKQKVEFKKLKTYPLISWILSLI